MLSYPPSLQPITGDNDAVSVAGRSPAGAYLLYLGTFLAWETAEAATATAAVPTTPAPDPTANRTSVDAARR